jgi:hypothetical protein
MSILGSEKNSSDPEPDWDLTFVIENHFGTGTKQTLLQYGTVRYRTYIVCVWSESGIIWKGRIRGNRSLYRTSQLLLLVRLESYYITRNLKF